MELARVRFLEKGEEAVLPKWAKLLPKSWGYLEKHRPYRLERDADGILGILQVQREEALSTPWRKGALSLLEALEGEGVSIIVPPAEGEFPRERLPFAEGRRLAALFAFEGAAEALRRQGKNPEECTYLLAGGDKGMWQAALSSMGNEVNHLAIFTQEPDGAEEIVGELYMGRGLVTEVFSSPKNPAFAEADVILSCGMEQRALEHILKKGAFWLDLAGNRPMLRRLMQLRPDVSAAEGFFFHVSLGNEEKQMEGRMAEAEAFLQCSNFRQSWGFPLEELERDVLLFELRERGFAVSGFSAFGKRVKIRRNP